MMEPLSSQFDPHFSFSWVFDAIHGYISIEDAVSDKGHTIKSLLAACRREQNSNHGSRQASMHVV